MAPPAPLATAGKVPPTYSTRLWASTSTTARSGTRISSAPARNFSLELPSEKTQRQAPFATLGRMLLCTVRDCHLPLLQTKDEGGRRLVCPSGHSFDVARSGYINL